VVTFGVAAIVLILALAAIFLFLSLPDANAFNARVERIFVENDALTTEAEIKLLEILALSGTAFSETLSSYRMVIFVLLVFATALLVAALVFLLMLVALNRRMAQIERAGIQVSSLLISREENAVYLNNHGARPRTAKKRLAPPASNACAIPWATNWSASFWSRTSPAAAICWP
jgi:type II secretory pathway component PulM